MKTNKRNNKKFRRTNKRNNKKFRRTKKGNNKMFRKIKKGKMHGGEPTPFKVGDLVAAKWSDGGKRDLDDKNAPYYNAKITKINDDDDGTFNIQFIDGAVQDNTHEKYITNVEREKEKERKALLETVKLVLRPALQPNKEYFMENTDGSFKYLGKYVETTYPWEGTNKRTEYERTFLHFSKLKKPIESSEENDEFYEKK
jgi:hypothetical protein